MAFKKNYEWSIKWNFTLLWMRTIKAKAFIKGKRSEGRKIIFSWNSMNSVKGLKLMRGSPQKASTNQNDWVLCKSIKFWLKIVAGFTNFFLRLSRGSFQLVPLACKKCRFFKTLSTWLHIISKIYSSTSTTLKWAIKNYLLHVPSQEDKG